jgi:molybdate/tungstate transport system substrate-binding protein
MHLLTTYATRAAHGPRRLVAIPLIAALAAALSVALLAGPQASAAISKSQPAAKHSGTVDVIAAGSLDTVLSKKIDNAFHKATGYTVSLTTGGSSTDAADIKNGIYVEDVFISAATADDKILMGSKNGSWVKWYANFATSPDVLGYYKKSKFAHDLKTEPWYQVITKKGFRIGRTVPSQDPGGVLAHAELLKAAKAHPTYAKALRKIATETSDEFPEDTEEADILTGQLDGAFMYEADANSQGSPFVKLGSVTEDGDYTVTLLKDAPHTAAAEAFIEFLAGKTSQSLMKKDHFNIVHPAKITGSGVPAAVKKALK